MYLVCTNNLPDESYHLVNADETLHSEYIPAMLECLNIKGAEYVTKIPKNMNNTESLYYKTVGKIFTPYITSNPMLFDTKNMDPLLKKHKLKVIKVNLNTN